MQMACKSETGKRTSGERIGWAGIVWVRWSKHMPINETVLLVDDDPVVLRVYGKLLRRRWTVIKASSVKEAKHELETRRVSVVLTDWNMTDGGGRAICEMAHFLPVVVWSGGGWQKGMEASDIFIEKPSSVIEIDKALWGAIKAWEEQT